LYARHMSVWIIKPAITHFQIIDKSVSALRFGTDKIKMFSTPLKTHCPWIMRPLLYHYSIISQIISQNFYLRGSNFYPNDKFKFQKKIFLGLWKLSPLLKIELYDFFYICYIRYINWNTIWCEKLIFDKENNVMYTREICARCWDIRDL